MTHNVRHKFEKSGSVVEFNVVSPRDPTNRNQIAGEIARAITSPYNQHITLLMVGQPGSGKSWAAMDLAYQAAYEVSQIIDGKHTPPGAWQKYFSLDHMAIVTLDRVTNLFKHIRQYGVYILDDIGVGYNARDWQKHKNRKMNEIIQTFRTDNTCVIYTVPDRFLIDKVPRSLVEKYMEFEKSEQLFSRRGGYESVNVYKYFNITSLKRDQKQFFAYMKDTIEGATQYVRHIAAKPPARLTVPYETIRYEVAKELRIANAESIENEEGGGEKTCVGGRWMDGMNNNIGLGPSEIETVERFVKANRFRKTDKNPNGLTRTKACDMAKLDLIMYDNIIAGRYKRLTEFMDNNNIPIAP